MSLFPLLTLALRRVVALLVLVAVMPSAQAARVQDLYTAELLVAQQTMQVDPQLAREALEQVLVKVSGQRSVVESAAVDNAAMASQRYIQQFSYQHSGQLLTNDAGQEVPAQRLRIDFIPSLVDQLLNQAGMRPLGAVRPGVLVWIVEERGQQRDFLGREEDPAFAPMRDQAQRRGLPIFRPLMDLQDQASLSVSDAWGFFAEPVQAASSRYQADAILVGRLYPEGGGWSSRWMLLREGRRILFDGAGGTLQQHLVSAVDQAADKVFADYVVTVAAEPQPGVLLEVGAIDSFADYAKLIDFLTETSAIRAVQLYEQNVDVLTLRLLLNSSTEQLQRALALNPQLQQQAGAQQPLSDAELFYRWSANDE